MNELKSIEQVRVYWEKERNNFSELAWKISESIKTLLFKDGINAEVTCRIKETSSIIKKIIYKRTSFHCIFDKIGLRVVVPFIQEMEPAKELIINNFNIINEDNKRIALKHDTMAYRSTHFLALESDTNNIFEIQLRTIHEDVWARVSHLLCYKNEDYMTKDILRRINLLSALLEVADMELNEIKNSIDRLPEAEPLRLLQILETHFSNLAGFEYDKELSIELLSHLRPITPDDIKDALDAYYKDNFNLMRKRYKEALRINNESDYILFQPEVLLIFWLLENKLHYLKSLWDEEYPLEALERIALFMQIPFQ